MQSKDGGTPLYIRWDYIYKEVIRPKKANPNILEKGINWVVGNRQSNIDKIAEFVEKREIHMKAIADAKSRKERIHASGNYYG